MTHTYIKKQVGIKFASTRQGECQSAHHAAGGRYCPRPSSLVCLCTNNGTHQSHIL